MNNATASAVASEPTTETIGLLAELVCEEIAAAAGQAERERDLLLAKQLAEHELRLMHLERSILDRLASLHDGERGEPGAKGEKGETGPQGEPGAPGAQGESIKGEAGEKGDAGEAGAPGAAGRDGVDGKPGERGEPGERGLDGKNGLDGLSFTIRDTYDPAEVYKQNDVVTLNATWFVARKTDPGPCPGPGWKSGPTGKRGEKGERGERGQRGDQGAAGREVVAFEIDRKDYALVTRLSDGSAGPRLCLRELFEQFQAESA